MSGFLYVETAVFSRTRKITFGRPHSVAGFAVGSRLLLVDRDGVAFRFRDDEGCFLGRMVSVSGVVSWGRFLTSFLGRVSF